MRRNPYTDLLKRIKEFASKVGNPRVRTMWTYPKDKIDGGTAWSLQLLRERVIAADQLKHDVVLAVDEGKIVVSYRERIEVPWQFKY